MGVCFWWYPRLSEFRETHQKPMGKPPRNPPICSLSPQVHLTSKLEWKKIHSQHDGYCMLLVINDYIIEYNWWLISIIVPISCNVPGIWWSWLPISVTPLLEVSWCAKMDSPPLFFHIVPRVKSLIINTHVGGWKINPSTRISLPMSFADSPEMEMGWMKGHFPHSETMLNHGTS